MRPVSGIAFMLLVASLAVGDQPGDKKKSESEWAKGVAVDFLKAVRAHKTDQALQLMTPKLEARRPGIDPPFPLGSGTVESWEFVTEKVAPDRDEVVLAGKVVGKHLETGYESPFTIRVVTDKDPSRWRIDYFLFEKCQELPAMKK